MKGKGKMACHSCGAQMKRGRRKAVYSYKDESIEVIQPGWYCTECDEVVLTAEDMAVTEPEFIDLKARVNGVLTPKEVKAVRARLRLSQRKASALLGGGPRSFQKYESGTAMVSRPMSNLLRVLDKHPELLKELRSVG